MKNIKIWVIFILCIGILSGCNNVLPKEDSSIKELKEDLSIMAKESAKEYFNLDIDINDFDISLAEEIDNDQFEKLKTTETTNNLYLVGHHKNKPKDIINFILCYDEKNKSIIEFGIETLDGDEVIYANLGEK